MGSWSDFDYGDQIHAPDTVEESAVDQLRDFFADRTNEVFFKNQLAVIHEDEYFHWITYRAIGVLIEEGDLLTETRKLDTGVDIKLVWDRRYRYYKRDAKRVVELVNEYGSPNMCGAIGLHGEQMILAAFAKRQFILQGHETRKYKDVEWTNSQHNIDFIFERDGLAYGIEVKNTSRIWTTKS